MKKSFGIVLGVAAVTAVAGYLILDLGAPSDDSAEQWAAIDRYCAECHNGIDLAGGLSFDELRHEALAAEAETWETAIRKLEGGFMPPPGAPRPEAGQLAQIVAWLERSLDSAYSASPDPGAPALHRLNRAEYANAIRDLLHLPIDVSTMLPADDSSAGFDNIASALSVSPALMQGYVSAAARISRIAVGDPTISPLQTTYSAPRGMSQDGHFVGMPFGTRGGVLAEHVFPLDAEYEISIRRPGSFFGLRNVGTGEPAVITLDGEELAVLGPNDGGSVRVRIDAGPHVLGAAVLASSRPRGVNDLFSEWGDTQGVSSVSIMGPLDATGAGDTPSRRRIFVCTPSGPEDEVQCAREVLSTLATRAYRRSVTEDDAAVDVLMGFYEEGRQLRNFEGGIQYALARVLVDPEFIYRFEQEPEDLAAGAAYELGDFELASRMSFFLWSSIPDDELLAVASEGRLTDRATREAQVRRMLADPKADALVENFAAQWFGLRELDSVLPETNRFDANLRAAFREETEHLFAEVLRRDLSIFELLEADYTFVNERLARHYGIPNIRGSRFRRVELGADARAGLLGHGSILTVTSAPNRTSPVSRGAWVLENILGTPPPAPPAGVETNLDITAADGPDPTSLRARLERHRSDPSCASCHALIDPIGFALENFDLIGEWRDVDEGEPIDATTQLWDGSEIVGAAGLREALLSRRDLFATHATEKLMTYALGRPIEATDMPAVREIVRDAAGTDYRLSSLILGIVESVPFRMKAKADQDLASAGG
jgi:hypothetical protein